MKIIFIIGFICISLIGAILHFTYDFSKHNKIVGLFSAVNESTWEHIKIALTPFFLWCLVDGYIYGSNGNYFLAKIVGVVSIIIIIPLIFYGYKIITKKPVLLIDISTFFVAIGLAQYFSYLILNTKEISYFLKYLSTISMFIIFGIYLVGTLFPVKSFLFKDPITSKYGLDGHSEINQSKKK